MCKKIIMDTTVSYELKKKILVETEGMPNTLLRLCPSVAVHCIDFWLFTYCKCKTHEMFVFHTLVHRHFLVKPGGCLKL